MAVDINPAAGVVGKPRLVPGLRVQSGAPGRNYDITPDGKFVTIVPAIDRAGGPAEQINVVLNWFRELERLVPTR
ncbi:MAG TPA: hypothetical protein VLK65_27090 [Vicinamibacteria bacterium]|nr:hypothetical protein [Vicinamibacteria bacterium]